MVSAEHASIYFDRGTWYLRDLASTNGTYISGQRVELGRKNPLGRGAEIGFGASYPVWRLICSDSPVARLRRVSDGSAMEPTGGLLLLPSDECPVLTLYQTPDGWVEERDGATRLLVDQAALECEGETYWVEMPPTEGDTILTGLVRGNGWAAFDDLTMRFDVSRDREAICWLVMYADETRILGNRAFHETLLVLAEERLRALEQGIGELEQGWLSTDELCRRVGGDSSKVNVDVFRARQQFEQLGVLDAHRIVERRASTRQLRLGSTSVSIRYDVTPSNMPDGPRSLLPVLPEDRRP